METFAAISLALIAILGLLIFVSRKNIGNPTAKTDSMLMREYKLHQQRVKNASPSQVAQALSEMSVLTDEMRKRGLISSRASNAPWIEEKILNGADLSQALNAGDPEAQFKQARVFMETNDIRQALHWLHLAAEQGHAEALYTLGFAHVQGKVEQNMTECIKWFTLSAARGDVNAEKALDISKAHATPEQFAEGVRLASAYQELHFRSGRSGIKGEGVNIEEDPVLTGCVRLTLGILEIQKKFILAQHSSMPPKAFDAFSLGYIAGTSLFISTLHEAGPDGYFLCLTIALNNMFGESGNELEGRVPAYIDALDPEFLSGKQTAEREIDTFFRQNAENRNLVVPPMNWAMHAIKEE